MAKVFFLVSLPHYHQRPNYMDLSLLLMPVISAFNGWFTSWIAIKMLIYPKKPIRFLGLTIQGGFPKNQKEFAGKLGNLVGKELLSFGDIESKITDPGKLAALMPFIEGHVDNFLRIKLKEKMPVISAFIGEKTIADLKSVFLEELIGLFPDLMKNYLGTLRRDLDLEAIVTQKVEAFSLDKFEEILESILSKEFKFIEIVGGALGFVIGVFQVLLSFWM